MAPVRPWHGGPVLAHLAMGKTRATIAQLTEGAIGSSRTVSPGLRLDQKMEAIAGASEPSLAESAQRAGGLRRPKDAEKRLAEHEAALGRGAGVAVVSAWIDEARPRGSA